MAIESIKQNSSSDLPIIRTVEHIKKSDSDSWHYRGLELSNELLIVLISHPNIDKAAAALDVSIGSLADPKDVPGIAHFLEHMLFMGSSKYPGENEYSKMIEGNGGYSNAFTSNDHTNFYFDVNPSVLPDALDVFAQFFISPLFAASSTDRELEAVNSEYEGNLFKDPWRMLQLEKSTSDSEHPYSAFSIGNTESLRVTPKNSGIDIREVLLKFHAAEYSSNRMSLAVLSNHSLDELQSFVIKSFKDVPNKKLEKVKYHADPYGEKNRKTICYTVPIKEHRHLTINWVIPDHKELYYCNPESYLSHLIGHEGDGSLLSYLKQLGLAIELTSGEKNRSPGFNFFTVDMELTIDGLNRWEEVIYIVYQYITMLRKEGPKEWIFNECKNLNTMHFQFREKERPDDFVSNLAGRMRDYPLTECLSGEYEMREFRPDLVDELLNEYLIPSKMRVFLTSKDFVSIATQKEKWFGTAYKQEYLPEALIKKCESCDVIPELHLPEPNEFIPTDFQLFSKETSSTRPQCPIKIKENEFYRLYYGEDSFYKLPKAYIFFEMRNPFGNIDPIHAVMNSLYVELIEDSLTEVVYPAQLGGLQYELSALNYGIQLTIHGFNHKIKQLLDQVIDRMVNIKLKTQRFEITKEKVKRALQNFRREVPYQMAHYGITYLTAEHQWSKDELLSCIDGITIKDLESFIPQMLSRFYIDSLMYGNLTKDQAIEYITSVKQKFQEKDFYQPLFPSMWFNQRELMLPEGCNYGYNMLNDAHQLNAIEVYLQCFQQTNENNALIELFSHFVDEPCFDQLRTKEQLGYIVNAGIRRSRGVQGFRVIVQSARDLEHVNKRIELFIDSIRDYILTMPDELFQKQREGYVVKKMEIPKKMRTSANKYWLEITNHQFCFERPQLEAEIIKKLDRNDIILFYDRYIAPHSTHRRKLALHVTPSASVLSASDNQKHAAAAAAAAAAAVADEVESTNDPSELLATADGPDVDIDVVENVDTNHETEEAAVQPLIIDNLIKTDSNQTQNVLSKKELDLPKVEWINNIHTWKSKLPCYPLAQSFDKIDIPVLCKL